MKNIIKITFLSLTLVVALALSASCTKWEEMNTDPYGLTTEMLQADYNNIGAYFPKLMQCVFYNYYNAAWDYQIISTIITDDWVGYMDCAQKWGDGHYPPNLGENDNWTQAEWSYTYSNVFSPIATAIQPQVEEAREGAATGKFDHFYAPALIIKVLAAHRLCDYYGPIIYTHYGEEGVNDPEFDSVKDAYYKFFEELDEAYGYLDTFVTENPGQTPFANFDNWCGGDYNTWLKLCNSVRLRLAMHIVKVDPSKAKTEAEKAGASKYGFLESYDVMESHDNWVHPNYTVTTWGNDTALGAVFESFMLGYNDPRCEKMFSETTNAAALAAGQKYWGFRLGWDPNVCTSEAYAGVSLFNTALKTLAGYIFSSAEAYFLRAEGALRGWSGMGGSAKDLYEAGVTASFKQWGVSGADTYLAGTSLPTDYVDYANSQFSISAVNHLCVKWDESASKEEKLERIIDQKYIAMWPESIEAWTELRRTGYPHQYPVMFNGSRGVLKDDETPKRVCYKAALQISNPQGYAGALSKLGGADNMATPLWWDIEGSNF